MSNAAKSTQATAWDRYQSMRLATQARDAATASPRIVVERPSDFRSMQAGGGHFTDIASAVARAKQIARHVDEYASDVHLASAEVVIFTDGANVYRVGLTEKGAA